MCVGGVPRPRLFSPDTASRLCRGSLRPAHQPDERGPYADGIPALPLGLAANQRLRVGLLRRTAVVHRFPPATNLSSVPAPPGRLPSQYRPNSCRKNCRRVTKLLRICCSIAGAGTCGVSVVFTEGCARHRSRPTAARALPSHSVTADECRYVSGFSADGHSAIGGGSCRI